MKLMKGTAVSIVVMHLLKDTMDALDSVQHFTRILLMLRDASAAA